MKGHAPAKSPGDPGPTIGLLLTNPADRRLVIGFLDQSGYRVRAGAPSETSLADWGEMSLIIADEPAARYYRHDLLALKQQTGGSFLPVLITLPETSESVPWLRAGFDDVLRVPVRKAELASRLQVYLQLRKQSEAQYREIFEHAPMGIYRATPEGRILMMNPAMLQMLGYGSFKEFAVSASAGNTAAGEARTQLKEFLARASERQGVEFAWRRDDDSKILVRAEARTIRGADGNILYYEGTIQDITERKQSEELLRQAKADLELRVAERTSELRTANLELRRLTQKVVLAQEEERERLSRELHDEIGQALTAVTFNLQAFQHLIVDPIVASRLQDSLNIVESTLQQVRDLSLNLHPAILGDLGLVAALQWYLDRQAERAGVTINLVADPPKMNLPSDLTTTCFRIVQEALTNTLRHAKAKKVQVELRQHDAELELVIRDDGAGFNVVAARQRAARGKSLGLLGMQERVALLKGRVKIKSARGAGTEIRARFPLIPTDRAKPARGRRKRRQT